MAAGISWRILIYFISNKVNNLVEERIALVQSNLIKKYKNDK